MAHTYANLLFHCVFSTKERRPFLTADVRERLWPYLGGIARENKMKALTVNGTADHVHMLLSLPTTLTVAKAIQTIKAASSRWVSVTFPGQKHFEWQEGYGAFSIGVSQVDATIRYIAGQKEHHRQKSFQEEFLEFLKKHDIAYDPRYVWG
jgi:REP element-mobilizing transposase RayT